LAFFPPPSFKASLLPHHPFPTAPLFTVGCIHRTAFSARLTLLFQAPIRTSKPGPTPRFVGPVRSLPPRLPGPSLSPSRVEAGSARHFFLPPHPDPTSSPSFPSLTFFENFLRLPLIGRTNDDCSQAQILSPLSLSSFSPRHPLSVLHVVSEDPLKPAFAERGDSLYRVFTSPETNCS